MCKENPNFFCRPPLRTPANAPGTAPTIYLALRASTTHLCCQTCNILKISALLASKIYIAERLLQCFIEAGLVTRPRSRTAKVRQAKSVLLLRRRAEHLLAEHLLAERLLRVLLRRNGAAPQHLRPASASHTCANPFGVTSSWERELRYSFRGKITLNNFT